MELGLKLLRDELEELPEMVADDRPDELPLLTLPREEVPDEEPAERLGVAKLPREEPLEEPVPREELGVR